MTSARWETCAIPELGDAEFAFFRELIHARAGIALSDSKRSLVAGRLMRRLRALAIGSFPEYRHYLQTSDRPDIEIGLLINCITTNKTSFFREEQHFAVLRDRIAAAERAGREVYRVWSAACATGEEPYSVAMTALGAARAMRVRVLASDLDTEVLACARKATYPMDSLGEMDEQFKHRYFLRGRDERAGWAQVKPAVRELVTFRQINLVADAWPIQTRFDAIFCRNVIIYFDRTTQERLFRRLVQYLTPDGLLFVGHAESLFWLNELLVPAGQEVYRARSTSPSLAMP